MNFRSIYAGAKFFIKKHAPELLITAGFVTTVGAGVYACTQTPKAVNAINQAKENMNVVNTAHETGAMADGNAYSEDDYRKDTVAVVATAAKEVIKTYALPVGIAVAGGVMIFSGNHMHKTRTAAAATCAASALSSLAAYRENIRKRFGDAADQAALTGNWGKTTTTIKEEKEDGSEENVTTWSEESHTIQAYSDYARFFDEVNCPNIWKPYQYENMLTLDRIERTMNYQLQLDGYVFLSDVYKELGIPVTKASRCVGWLSKKRGGRDGFISFGHKDLSKESSCRFLNGEPSVILDFNVDGPIMDLLPDI